MTVKQLTAAQKKAAAKAEAEAQAAELAKTEAIADAVDQSQAVGTEQAQADGTDQAGTDTGENPVQADAGVQVQADAGVQAQAQNNAKEKGTELTPYQLRVKNNGQRSMCHVTHALIEANSETVITYQSIQDKDLAKGNFAQINKLKGSKRFEVEG